MTIHSIPSTARRGNLNPSQSHSSAFSSQHRALPNLALTGISPSQTSPSTNRPTEDALTSAESRHSKRLTSSASSEGTPDGGDVHSKDGSRDGSGTGSGKKTPRRVQWARGTSQPPTGTRSAPPGRDLYSEDPPIEEDGDDDIEVSTTSNFQSDVLPIPLSSRSLLARQLGIKDDRLGADVDGDVEGDGDATRSILSLDEEGLDVRIFSPFVSRLCFPLHHLPALSCNFQCDQYKY